MEFVSIVDSLLYVIKNAMSSLNWIFTPIQIGEHSFSPILIVSFSALAVLIPIAIVKWVIS